MEASNSWAFDAKHLDASSWPPSDLFVLPADDLNIHRGLRSTS